MNITLKFADNAEYSYTTTEPDLIEGGWGAPFAANEDGEFALRFLEGNASNEIISVLTSKHGPVTHLSISSAPDKTEGIYTFYWDLGRSGEVSGTFVATREDVASLLGEKIYFGEILGKHSDIYGVVKEDDITLVDESARAIEMFKRLSLATGHNPFDYLEN